ncbi:MAG: pyridoxal phosphate-dependent aminotransferase family protein [Bacteroidales bacterium]|nr:pyridoxal phosphate-dependent aminotransferase family protein [Bacteroidales bacterium]MDY3782717.1 pyridoxal phosphate-dependent aminotransferase family protein [Candidatus Cryptobacteroides sp.]
MENTLKSLCRNYTVPQQIQQLGIYPYYKPISSGQNPVVRMADGRDVLMFGSNSYLGLSDDPRLKEAATKAIEKYGTSCSGSRFLNGTLDIHEELEARLAAFVGKQQAVTFSTGFQVNLGVVSTLGQRGGYILLDDTDHACIIDGSRLSFSTVYKFRHNDMEVLESKLKVCEADAPKLIVVDGVYSMLGDLCPLPELCELAAKYDAAVMVDDAHGLGVFGKNGSGTVAHFGLTDEVDLIMGTFSKSFGSLGGFIAGDSEYINYIRHTARSLIFSASMTPAAVAAASRALDIMQEEPERIEKLWEVTHYAHKAFRDNGFDINATVSPIIPLMVRNTQLALSIVAEAYNDGVFITPVIAPAVPEKDVLIRFALMATHTTAQVDEAVEKLGRIFRKYGIIS